MSRQIWPSSPCIAAIRGVQLARIAHGDAQHARMRPVELQALIVGITVGHLRSSKDRPRRCDGSARRATRGGSRRPSLRPSRHHPRTRREVRSLRDEALLQFADGHLGGVAAMRDGQGRGRARGVAGQPALRDLAHEGMRGGVAGEVAAGHQQSPGVPRQQATIRHRHASPCGAVLGLTPISSACTAPPSQSARPSTRRPTRRLVWRTPIWGAVSMTQASRNPGACAR